MTEINTDALRVPGASPHHEIRDRGPALLPIGGGRPVFTGEGVA
jgi:hypothetical protein